MFHKKYFRAWFTALSGLSINVSAIWFGGAFIGSRIFPPESPKDFNVLILDAGFGILFLLIAVILEKQKEKYE